jgi:hypothetical protein
VQVYIVPLGTSSKMLTTSYLAGRILVEQSALSVMIDSPDNINTGRKCRCTCDESSFLELKQPITAALKISPMSFAFKCLPFMESWSQIVDNSYRCYVVLRVLLEFIYTAVLYINR